MEAKELEMGVGWHTKGGETVGYRKEKGEILGRGSLSSQESRNI